MLSANFVVGNRRGEFLRWGERILNKCIGIFFLFELEYFVRENNQTLNVRSPCLWAIYFCAIIWGTECRKHHQKATSKDALPIIFSHFAIDTIFLLPTIILPSSAGHLSSQTIERRKNFQVAQLHRCAQVVKVRPMQSREEKGKSFWVQFNGPLRVRTLDWRRYKERKKISLMPYFFLLCYVWSVKLLLRFLFKK